MKPKITLKRNSEGFWQATLKNMFAEQGCRVIKIVSGFETPQMALEALLKDYAL